MQSASYAFMTFKNQIVDKSRLLNHHFLFNFKHIWELFLLLMGTDCSNPIL